MSDDWIVLIPEDPRFIPEVARRNPALELFQSMVPDAEDVEITLSETISFFDCGENFERVGCPSCRTEIPNQWFMDRMEEDFCDGFKLLRYAVPCCGTVHTLHELVYVWPQGFGRFALEAMNPNIGKLTDSQRLALENALGTSLRVIYQHI